MATIQHVPGEIATLISGHLAKKDLLNLRQTCKSLNIKTFSVFARCYFYTGSVMIEQHSLDDLLRISQHPILGPSIQTLQISLHHLLPLDELRKVNDAHGGKHVRGLGEDSEASDDEVEQNSHRNPYGAGPSMPVPSHILERRHQPKLNKTAYLECLADQDELFRTGRGITTLTKALQGLSNCKEIYVSHLRSPYGLNRLRKRIGFLPREWLTPSLPSSVEFVRNALHTMSVAVAKSQISITNLAICDGSDSFWKRIQISPDILVKSNCPISNKIKVPNVTSLSLIVDAKNHDDEPNVPKKWENDLALFIHRYPNVSALSLKCEICKTNDALQYRNPFRWADGSNRSRFSKLCTIMHVPKLEELTLKRIDFTGAELGFLILRHMKTLKRFIFSNAQLVDYQRPWSWLLRLIYENIQITELELFGCELMGRPIGLGLSTVVTSNKELLDVIEKLEDDEGDLQEEHAALFDQPVGIPGLQGHADEYDVWLRQNMHGYVL